MHANSAWVGVDEYTIVSRRAFAPTGYRMDVLATHASDTTYITRREKGGGGGIVNEDLRFALE